MTDAPHPIAEVRNCQVMFGQDGQKRTVLENVTLGVRPGEVLAILGPSGCGKSTLLRAMVGLIKPSAGEVLAHGSADDRHSSWRGDRLPELRAVSLADGPGQCSAGAERT